MRSLHHPWTLGLATGKTSLASFKNYVAQDAYFLRAFAKAYAYALAKAEDEEDIRAFHSLIGSVLEELGLHASYSAKWGIDVANVRAKTTGATCANRVLYTPEFRSNRGVERCSLSFRLRKAAQRLSVYFVSH